jgi:hypothetical protein
MSEPACLQQECTHWIRAEKTTSCGKALRKNHGRTSPRREARTYITSSGLQRPKDEHQFLIRMGRPAVMEVVAWAAIAVKTPTISTASGG